MENPTKLKLRDALCDFEQGVLCFVVARRHQGRGALRLILHRVKLPEPNSGFGYGAFGHYTVSPGTLAAYSNSPAKVAASRANGKKGGRPKKAVEEWE